MLPAWDARVTVSRDSLLQLQRWITELLRSSVGPRVSLVVAEDARPDATVLARQLEDATRSGPSPFTGTPTEIPLQPGTYEARGSREISTVGEPTRAAGVIAALEKLRVLCERKLPEVSNPFGKKPDGKTADEGDLHERTFGTDGGLAAKKPHLPKEQPRDEDFEAFKAECRAYMAVENRERIRLKGKSPGYYAVKFKDSTQPLGKWAGPYMDLRLSRYCSVCGLTGIDRTDNCPNYSQHYKWVEGLVEPYTYP